MENFEVLCENCEEPIVSAWDEEGNLLVYPCPGCLIEEQHKWYEKGLVNGLHRNPNEER